MMEFIILKIVQQIIVPPASLLLIMAAGFFLLRPLPRLGRVLIGASLVLFYLLSIRPVSEILLGPLESYSQPLKDQAVKVDAIVVLGGGVVDPAVPGLTAEASGGGLARLVKGITLYRAVHRPLVLMGGNGDPSRRNVTADADAMAPVARNLGVPGKDIIIENRSRNTLEGASNLGKLIPGKRIALVTSAYHMRRAAGMFRKQGFTVVTVPAGFLREGRSLTWQSFIPTASALHASSTACAEYLSLAWYHVAGEVKGD